LSKKAKCDPIKKNECAQLTEAFLSTLHEKNWGVCSPETFSVPSCKILIVQELNVSLKIELLLM
jgi:hypothetical protein